MEWCMNLDLEAERKKIMEEAINFGLINNFFTVKDLLKYEIGKYEYMIVIKSILRYYRSSKEFIGIDKNLLNQMIVDEKFIPFFDILTIDEEWLKIFPEVKKKEINEKENEIKQIVKKTKKQKISKQERIHQMISLEINQQTAKIEEKSMLELIEEANKRIKEAKEYIKIISDNM